MYNDFATPPARDPNAVPIAADEIASRPVDPLACGDWDAMVWRFPNASFFHTVAWARVLHETYGFRPLYFIGRDRTGGLAGLIPIMEVDSWLTGRRGLSLPFTDECEPLGVDHSAIDQIVDAIAAFGAERRWKYVELRTGYSASLSPASVSFHGHKLILDKCPAQLFEACDSATRRGVRKAEKVHLNIELTNDIEAIRAFYLLVRKTRKRQGLPPQPWQFFENIHRYVLARGAGCVALARLEKAPVAGALFLHFGSTVLFKFGASDKAYQHLRPNNLVMWRAIEWHARAGFESIDFGRTTLGNEGLRRFKLGWGTTERLIHYARFDCRTREAMSAPDRSVGWHRQFFKVLPLTLNRLLGAAAYKHIA